MKDPTFADSTGISITAANGVPLNGHSSVHLGHDKTSYNKKICDGDSHISTHEDSDVYDLVLTDGKEMLKCLLSPSCNYLVQNCRVGKHFLLSCLVKHFSVHIVCKRFMRFVALLFSVFHITLKLIPRLGKQTLKLQHLMILL
jgi:hypothetical protein